MYHDTDNCCFIDFAYAHACDPDCERTCNHQNDPLQERNDIDEYGNQHACKPPNLTKHRCKYQTLAMAYVPAQCWNTTFDYETGFMKGTIFPELYMPFHKEGACHDE